MPRKQRRQRKCKVSPLAETISTFSDIGYDDDRDCSSEYIQKEEEVCEDETDKMWMYETDELLEKKEEKKPSEEEEEKAEAEEAPKVLSKAALKKQKKADLMMDAAVWFKDMADSNEITDDEKRYVELMIIQLSRFYFANLGSITPSPKCAEAIANIGGYIAQAAKA